MWDLVMTGFDGEHTEKIDKYLEDGYEPFQIFPDAYVGYTICLKKEVDEIRHERQELDKKPSRKATGKSKAKDSS